jgi:hypothetical protein
MLPLFIRELGLPYGYVHGGAADLDRALYQSKSGSKIKRAERKAASPRKSTPYGTGYPGERLLHRAKIGLTFSFTPSRSGESFSPT